MFKRTEKQRAPRAWQGSRIADCAVTSTYHLLRLLKKRLGIDAGILWVEALLPLELLVLGLLGLDTGAFGPSFAHVLRQVRPQLLH